MSLVHKVNGFASFPGVQGLGLCYACAHANDTHSFRTSPTQGSLLPEKIINMTINIHGPLRHCNQDLLPNKFKTSVIGALLSSECTTFWATAGVNEVRSLLHKIVFAFYFNSVFIWSLMALFQDLGFDGDFHMSGFQSFHRQQALVISIQLTSPCWNFLLGVYA